MNKYKKLNFTKLLPHKTDNTTVSHLFDVHQGGGVSAEPLQLLLRGESGRAVAGGGKVGAGQRRDIEDHAVVSHQQLHHQGLVGVVHQGGQRHLCVYLPRLHQRRAEDDAQVARRHLVLFRLLRHPVSAERGIVSLTYTGQIFSVRADRHSADQYCPL